MFTLRRELKVFGIILAIAALALFATFIVMFFQAFAEGQQFKKDCRLLSENLITRQEAWHCIDGVTYWKRDGIIIERIGKKGTYPKYGGPG